MNRVRHGWLAIALLLAIPHIAAGDGPTIVTTAPRPPDTAYAQLPVEDLPPPRLDTLPPPGASSGPASPAPELRPLFDPVLDSPHRQRWLQVDFPAAWLMFPQFNQTLTAPVAVGSIPANTLALPTPPLDFIGAPAFTVRANLRDFGTVELGYRFIVTEGAAFVLGVDPTGAIPMRSRLDVQMLELTYARHEFQTHGRLIDLLDQDLRISDLQGMPEWVLSWDLGVRVANLYFDAHAIGSIVDRQIVNYFIGGGPKIGLTLTKPISNWGFALFSRVDVGAMMGTVRQQFSELSTDAGGNPLAFGYATKQQVQTVPTLAAQFGVSGAPRRLGYWQVGYQFEQWWAVANVAGSSGDFLAHSIFARWLWSY